jgi:hypothetical protein
MDNPEKLATLGTQDTGQINVRENRKDNQEWTIQRNWQHWEHKTKTNKRKHNTIYVRHHHMQTNTNIGLFISRSIRPWYGLVVLIKLWWTH